MTRDTRRTDGAPAQGPALARRRLFGGAATVGALAAAAAVLPRVDAPSTDANAAASPEAGADGGYRLTEHIQRYYQTARV